jgi:hypothetical protein
MSLILLRQNVITEEFYGERGGFNEKYWIPITTRVSHWENRGRTEKRNLEQSSYRTIAEKERTEIDYRV